MLCGSAYTIWQFIVYLYYCKATLMMIAKVIKTCQQLIICDKKYFIHVHLMVYCICVKLECSPVTNLTIIRNWVWLVISGCE
jgi:hypothetical protein